MFVYLFALFCTINSFMITSVQILIPTLKIFRREKDARLSPR